MAGRMDLLCCDDHLHRGGHGHAHAARTAVYCTVLGRMACAGTLGDRARGGMGDGVVERDGERCSSVGGHAVDVGDAKVSTPAVRVETRLHEPG